MDAKTLKLDYFQVYDVVDRPVDPEQAGKLQLKGQFDKGRVSMVLKHLDFFANPVSKNGEPLFDKQAHLAWYVGAQPAEPARVVSLENQFGKFEIQIGRGRGLLVPTQKIEPGSVLPRELDHYKVYQVLHISKPLQQAMRLRDQFRASEARLTSALFFAVPVQKWHNAATQVIQNPKTHLLIVGISPRPIEKAITIRNQFVKRAQLSVQRSVMLAIPSVKRGWKPA
jgi:BarA-like signal transduction histidine kinase